MRSGLPTSCAATSLASLSPRSPDGAQRNPGQVYSTVNPGFRCAPSGLRHFIRVTGRCLDLPLDHLQLELGDGFGRVEALWAGLGAVHDGVAAVEPERVFEIVEPFAGGFIAGIFHPARRLQQRGRAQEALAVPPIARARGRAAGAEDALVEAVEFLAVLVALLPFLLRRRRGGLQPRLDRSVLGVEVGEVG